MATDLMAIAYKDFRFWFIRDMKQCEYKISNAFKVYDKDSQKFIGMIFDSMDNAIFNPECDVKVDEAAILKEFSLYKQTDEAKLGDVFDVENLGVDSLKQLYMELLIGAVNLRKFNGKDDHEAKGYPMWSNNLQWLQKTNFFTTPASSKFHDACDGGLLKHSIKVYNHMMELYQLEQFQNVPLGSAALVALIHDWCKIGLYEKCKRNVKDENTGKWYQEDAWKFVNENLIVPGGHGATSMFFAVRMFSANIEESMAIRWHMGEYNVAQNESYELQECNERYPLVFMLQFADRLSTVRY